MSLPTFYLEIYRVTTLKKKKKNAKFLVFYWIKIWKTCMIMAAPNFQILLSLKLVKKFGFVRITHSDTRPHSTVRNARQNGFLTEQCSFQISKFCFVQGFLSNYVIETLTLIQYSVRI